MVENPGIGNIRNLLTFIKSTGKALPLKIGTIVKAQVIKMTDEGEALLRIAPTGGNKESSRGTIIRASPEVPLTKGQNIFLEIIGSKNNLTLRFIGEFGRIPQAAQQNIPAKLLDMLAQLSGSRPGNSEFHQLLNMLKSLPQDIKTAIPEFRVLEKLLINIKQIDEKLLKMPLSKVQNIFIKILGGKSNLTTLFIDESGRIPQAPQQNIPVKLLDMLAQLSGSKPGNSEFHQLLNILKSLPQEIKTAIPEFRVLEKLLINIKQIDGKLLEVPLSKGQNIFIKILGDKSNLTTLFIADSGRMPQTAQQNIPVKLLDMLAQLSGSRPGNLEFQQLINMLKSLPQSIKNEIPEFRGLEKLLMDVKQIDGKILKAFIETSGVAFETRLKIAALQDPTLMLQSLIALRTEGDLKSLLMQLINLLKTRGAINTLKKAGHNITDISGTVSKFIDNIEFFQLTSKFNDMFYTFLPVMWDDLKDGEFLFKKDSDNSRESYTCDINLDLESLGKLSISVTISDNSFFITFLTERNEVKELIRSQKHLLEDRFESLGLPLKAVNCNYRKNITFGKPTEKGMDVKV